MIATNLFRRMRGGPALRGYRRGLHAALAEALPAQLHAALTALPLPIDLDALALAPTQRGASNHAVGAGHTLATLLPLQRAVALYGRAGSGRGLLLRQLAWRWASGTGRVPTLLLDLPYQDSASLAPQAVLSAALATAGLGERFGAAAPVLLLLDGWEDLSAERRAAWHSFLLALPEAWPAAQIVLALPDASVQRQHWPGYAWATPAALDQQQLLHFLALLLPRYDLEPLLAALAPAAALAGLRESPLDLLLLALCYPEAGLPACRAGLWEQAYARLRTPVGASTTPGWLANTRAMRCYGLARELGQTQGFERLTSLPPAQRDALVGFAAELLPDPTPLYAALWGAGQPDQAALLTLGQCLRLRLALTTRADLPLFGHADSAHWPLRIVAQLAACAGEQAEVGALLDALLPSLDGLLEAALASDPACQRELLALLPLLPAAEAAPRLWALLDAPALAEDLRWAAADALLEQAPAAERWQTLAGSGSDALGCAARIYLFALCAAAGSALLHSPEALDWAAALLAQPGAGAERRLRAGSALLATPTLPDALRVAAVGLLEHSETPLAREALRAACNDTALAVRHAALLTLRHHAPAQSLELLITTLLDCQSAWPARLDALALLGDHPQAEASVLLARCALTASVPLRARLIALQALARRRGGALLLRKLLRAPAAADAVRAAAAQLLAEPGMAVPAGQAPLFELAEAALDGRFPLAQRAATRALGRWGAADTSLVLELLGSLVEGAAGEPVLIETAVVALGELGGPEAVPLLAALLGQGASERLRGLWPVQFRQAGAPQLWELEALPQPLRLLLATALAACDTAASAPSTLDELLEPDANALAAAAACALARIGGQAARVALERALCACTGSGAEVLIDSLAQLDPSGAALRGLLARSELNTLVRWHLAQRCATSTKVDTALLLQTTAEHTFARSALPQALGQRLGLGALPTLRRLAEDHAEDMYVRTQAIAALGALADPASETTLLQIVTDANAPLELRRQAAEALPAAISGETRLILRELLRRERLPIPLLVGLLAAVGVARDRESLPALLRYCQSEQNDVAAAALLALEQIGDADVIPVLVRVSQSPVAARAVRLQAVGTALLLGGEAYLALLRTYLDCGVLPLQLQALDYLLCACPDTALLPALLRDQSAAVPLRRRVAQALSERDTWPDSTPELLVALLTDAGEPQELRALAAELLGRLGSAHPSQQAALDTLANSASDARQPAGLRWRCIAALAVLDTPAAWLVLSHLADDPTQPEDTRAWATAIHLSFEGYRLQGTGIRA